MNVRRILIFVVAFLALIVCCYLTRSWTAPLIIMLALVLYGAGMAAYRLNERKHLKRTGDNPSLR
jgi:disulfide bond formation protein DsbB